MAHAHTLKLHFIVIKAVATFVATALLLSCVTSKPGKDIGKIMAEFHEAYKDITIRYEIGRDNVVCDGRTITIYSGFANNPLINKNGLKIAICHEVGHLLGPKDRGALYADERISDVYAITACSSVMEMSRSELQSGIESIYAWYRMYSVQPGYPTASERYEIMAFTLGNLK